MEGLERLIDRVKQAMSLGADEAQIREDLLAQHIHKELVFWAIKSARFEINEEKKADSDRIN